MSQFPFLYEMNVEQLQNIIQNDSTLNDWVKQNDEVRSVQLQRETLLATNRSLAEHNLSREPRLKSSKSRLASVHTEAAKLRQKFDQDKQHLDALAAQNSLDTILVMLRSAAGSSEDDAERIADHFLEGELSTDIFLEQYIATRKEAHIRRISAEKMAEIRDKRQSQQHVHQPSAQTYTPYVPGGAAGTQPGAGTGTGGGVPYPTGGYTPMPSPFSYR